MKLLIISIILIILTFIGFNKVNAGGKPYSIYHEYIGSDVFLVAVGDNGGIGICKR